MSVWILAKMLASFQRSGSPTADSQTHSEWECKTCMDVDESLRLIWYQMLVLEFVSFELSLQKDRCHVQA